MNILFLDSIETETYGGMEEWIRLNASGLANKGHSVTVAGRRGSEFLRRVAESSGDVDMLELDISGDFSPGTIAALKKCLRERSIDIISVNFNKDVRLGGLAARLDGKARVVWSVGLDITKDSLIHKLLTPRLVDGVVVPSESLKKQITRHGYIKADIVEVIPIGIPEVASEKASDDVRAKYSIPEDCVVAVTSGRFVEQKGHRYLVEAASEIVKVHSKIRFLLLGDGPLEGELRAQIEASGLGEYFVFAGMLDDVAPALACSDMMVHPSIEEPFGIAIVEGLRAGLPVVASRVGGIPEVVGESAGALLVETRDPRALTEAVGTVVVDSSYREGMATASRERFEAEFSDVVMYDRVERYFASLMRSEAVHGDA